jgi:hypothetical protein
MRRRRRRRRIRTRRRKCGLQTVNCDHQLNFI